ncbi:hypothetical protein N136_00890 [Leifsonia aquatica ATCC 14665]|uniref:Uncharacterized protein n=1 Tax=Leifsonia aquatica ATCC 14665 TaxID=1358026 RepID=U2RVC5_LEIAQ|nr:hypothetical protein N136_00890 [Leifsonia aquatica ATCC 14665]
MAVLEHGADDERSPDDRGKKPEQPRGQQAPKGELGSVVDVERGQHGDVGDSHGDDVWSVAGSVEPTVDEPEGGRDGSDGTRRNKGQIGGPPEGGHRARGSEDDQNRSEVEPATDNVPAGAFSAEHGNQPTRDCDQSRRDVDSEQGEEDGGERGYVQSEQGFRAHERPPSGALRVALRKGVRTTVPVAAR